MNTKNNNNVYFAVGKPHGCVNGRIVYFDMVYRFKLNREYKKFVCIVCATRSNIHRWLKLSATKTCITSKSQQNSQHTKQHSDPMYYVRNRRISLTRSITMKPMGILYSCCSGTKHREAACCTSRQHTIHKHTQSVFRIQNINHTHYPSTYSVYCTHNSIAAKESLFVRTNKLFGKHMKSQRTENELNKAKTTTR